MESSMVKPPIRACLRIEIRNITHQAVIIHILRLLMIDNQLELQYTDETKRVDELYLKEFLQKHNKQRGLYHSKTI